MILWDYEIECGAIIHKEVPCPLFQAQEKMPYEHTFSNQRNIYNGCNKGWHEQVHYRDFGSFPENKENLE